MLIPEQIPSDSEPSSTSVERSKIFRTNKLKLGNIGSKSAEFIVFYCYIHSLNTMTQWLSPLKEEIATKMVEPNGVVCLYNSAGYCSLPHSCFNV